MVSYAKLDLPEPERPVKTTILFRGSSRLMFFRQWSELKLKHFFNRNNVRDPLNNCFRSNAVLLVIIKLNFSPPFSFSKGLLNGTGNHIGINQDLAPHIPGRPADSLDQGSCAS